MLTEIETKAIDAAARAFGHKDCGAADALSVIQKSRGWISDQTLEDLAAYLHMTTAELDETATFYNRIYRRPVGKHVILLCDSVSCWICGYGPLQEHLLKTLGLSRLCETTTDGMFTVLPAACLGACDHAPAMMVDDELFGDLTTEKIDQILHKIRTAPDIGVKRG
jgi:NADH-quinone oxidoreductase subunit E